jgi:hypothetical protein
MHHWLLDHDMEYQYEHIQKNLLSIHLICVLLNQYQKEQLEENLQLTNCLLQSTLQKQHALVFLIVTKLT